MLTYFVLVSLTLFIGFSRWWTNVILKKYRYTPSFGRSRISGNFYYKLLTILIIMDHEIIVIAVASAQNCLHTPFLTLQTYYWLIWLVASKMFTNNSKHCIKSSEATCCQQTKHLQFIIFNNITAHQNLK